MMTDYQPGYGIPVYAPWAERELITIRQQYEQGEIPILYLELSATCTQCRCLYCDSPSRGVPEHEMDLPELTRSIDQTIQHGLRWVYICGLGEPSEDQNLFPLLDYLNRSEVSVTIFTNGLGFQRNDIQRLKLLRTNLILKLDTFQTDTFDRILGSSGIAARIYRFLDWLLEESFVQIGKGGITNLALSIVPTSLNIDDIPYTVKFCKEHSAYPVIGEMELVGRAAEHAEILNPSDKDLENLSTRITEVLGHPYARPLCPGIIYGLHIDHVGNCIVDLNTGLSCGWFIADSSKMVMIGNIRSDSVAALWARLKKYRLERFAKTIDILKNKKVTIACGGGARPPEWVNTYVNAMRAVTQQADF
jgi:MoaA/NifB/PqqE/SkfB family radical SAM enzyme